MKCWEKVSDQEYKDLINKQVVLLKFLIILGLPSMERRCLVLTQGQTHPTPAKLAAALLRYKPESVIALLDPENAGRDAFALLQVGKGIPIVASLKDALLLRPDTLVLGITPSGGQLPENWRQIILQAISAGLNIVSGLHSFLNDDPEFATAAQRYHVQLVDLRKPPDDLTVNTCRARHTKTLRIHTVGTDCNCGKKVTAIEIDRALRASGRNSVFVATGQSGILVSGRGIALDRVVADFVAGAAERLVLENTEYDYLCLEGQGAIIHPLYSGVTLSMLHGFMPQALILCHQPDRTIMRGTPDIPVPPLEEMIRLYEQITAPVYPARVIGIALNLMAFPENVVSDMIHATEEKTGLPVTDVIRAGAGKLVDAILEFEKKLKADEQS